jgi:hypothetical protein
MPRYFTPHSSEWFDALAAFNPAQVAHTRTILKAAGRDDVCSICGDDPASDFQIVLPFPDQNAVATVRLCDDCQKLREMNGESYIPFQRE